MPLASLAVFTALKVAVMSGAVRIEYRACSTLQEKDATAAANAITIR
jgi:hypothetical protein